MAISNWDYDKMMININSCRVPVIVEFWMPGCVPCIHLSLILETLEEEYKNRIVFGKCRADEYKGDSALISSVPTTVINTNGKVFEVFQGLIDEDKLRESLNNAIEDMDNNY
jgi:thioredoxin-like negative regulator of GroEL